MGISFKSTFRAAKHSKKIVDEKQRQLGIGLEEAKALMLLDIESGKGFEGTFKPYSPQYAAYKKEKLGRTTVNLRETGDMLKAMQTYVVKTSEGLLGKIFFLAQERKKAQRNKELRPNFFGLSAAILKRILNRLK